MGMKEFKTDGSGVWKVEVMGKDGLRVGGRLDRYTRCVNHSIPPKARKGQ